MLFQNSFGHPLSADQQSAFTNWVGSSPVGPHNRVISGQHQGPFLRQWWLHHVWPTSSHPMNSAIPLGTQADAPINNWMQGVWNAPVPNPMMGGNPINPVTGRA